MACDSLPSVQAPAQPTKPNPWDQQPGESDQSYARFLSYLILGPFRTVKQAYADWHKKNRKSNKSLAREQVKATCVSGAWTNDCLHFRWRDRATSYDLAQLEIAGREVANRFVATVNGYYAAFDRIAEQVNAKSDPQMIHALLAGIKELAAFVRLPEPRPASADNQPSPVVTGNVCGACEQSCDGSEPGEPPSVV